MAGELKIERRDDLALLTLSHPARRNALDPGMLAALVEALEDLPSTGVRAAVLTGEGDRAFSAGFDLSALPENAPATENPLSEALRAVRDGALPVVAALNGLAVGGGCELAATCDLRVAHPGVTLTMPPVRLGLIYASSGLARFLSLIGAAHTRELFLTAQAVDAERALTWGLVDRIVADRDVLPTAFALAREIARGAPLAIRGTRRALEVLTRPPANQIAALEAAGRAAWESEDAREARAAFREKRPPRFTGR